ncbi:MULTISPECIES: peptidylprolyl isomerase [unclassified Ruegeria]|uniref:peptidylprolyl isomerase n=1 Tax=unclassified Ruegeria TaxID=2625375 RepID=UPI001ADB5AE6|nr:MULTISPECIES: peptidylprolyl isomerase [unclassified Ruegeria]MBO9412157.1 peptidylprolyl isomerase [Ruegeria sp. R8_1]MBO9417537.1 peptidylprolyl isomerase [Ruegeria sp. R8_2]
MPKGLTFLPSLALTAMMALPLAAETKPDASTVVARVNGDEITLGHVIATVATLPANYQQIEDDVLYDFIIEQLIQQQLLGQQQDELTKLNALALANETRSLLAVQTVNALIGDLVTDEAIQSAYDARFAEFEGEDEFNASHILVETEEEANEIKSQLDDGADFAELAKEKSTGPSGPNGGELGWFGKGRMVPEFETAVIGLDKEQVSDPVQTQFGWHVIILNDKRKTEAPELDAVREELAQTLQNEAIQARIDELTQSAQIDRPEIEGMTPGIVRQLDLIQE